MGITKVVTEANLSKPILCKLSSPYQSLVGGAITILKKYEFVNGKDDIPYMKWNIIQMFQTTNQILFCYISGIVSIDPILSRDDDCVTLTIPLLYACPFFITYLYKGKLAELLFLGICNNI